MHKFTRNLLTEWRKLKLPMADGIFLIAVSGGADSSALALALKELRERKKLNLRFVITHFNHNLRGAESDADEQFVRELAVKYDFELMLGHWKDAKKGNLEQAARRARYEFLTETARVLQADGVLTAHTVNDQAETFLMNLIRGSGLEGLSGMKPVRNLEADSPEKSDAGISKRQTTESQIQNLKSRILLIRPLLNWAKRCDTERFCHERGVIYRSDTMNEDLAFRRVRIRKVLLPLLRDFNPKIIETLAQTANLLRDEAEVLKNRAPLGFEDTEIILRDIKNIPAGERRRILRAWLEARRGSLRQLDLKHIEALEHLVTSEKSGKIVELPNNERVVKSGGRLKFRKSIEKL